MYEETTTFPNIERAENTTANANITYYPWNGVVYPQLTPPPSPTVNVSCSASLSDEDKAAIKAMIREAVKEEFAQLKRELANDVISELGRRIRTQMPNRYR